MRPGAAPAKSAGAAEASSGRTAAKNLPPANVHEIIRNPHKRGGFF